MGSPLHSTKIISPSANLLISALVGAPAALALALGLNADKKGMAAPTTPTAPTTEVAAIRNYLLPGLEVAFGCILPF